MLFVNTIMNIQETVVDWLLQLLLIVATEHYVELYILITEELLKDLLEQVKQRQLKIQLKLQQDIVLSTIAQMVSILKPWVNSLKDFLKVGPGLVLMSLTESILKYFQSLPSKYSAFKMQEREVTKGLNLKELKYF